MVCTQDNQPAPEVCEGVLDENCNGQVDEGCTCVDNDLDGYCAGPDCDDSDPHTNAYAPEICGDNKDNN